MSNPLWQVDPPDALPEPDLEIIPLVPDGGGYGIATYCGETPALEWDDEPPAA